MSPHLIYNIALIVRKKRRTSKDFGWWMEEAAQYKESNVDDDDGGTSESGFLRIFCVTCARATQSLWQKAWKHGAYGEGSVM